MQETIEVQLAMSWEELRELRMLLAYCQGYLPDHSPESADCKKYTRLMAQAWEQRPNG